jgi:hypothetical protein
MTQDEMIAALESLTAEELNKITPELAQQLFWWQSEGGREILLSELPIERRRALEKEARENPGK